MIIWKTSLNFVKLFVSVCAISEIQILQYKPPKQTCPITMSKKSSAV
jgi:hypothetical protein